MIQVATLNTWKGEGAYIQRLDLMLQGLKKIAPDILLLQEAVVSVKGHIDTARELADGLGLLRAFLPARRKFRMIEGSMVDCYSGLAVLSRKPIRTVATLRLSEDPRDGDRHCQLVVVDLPKCQLLVGNTHLTHLPDRDDLRCQQLAEIVEQMAYLAERRPAILGGDFNASDADTSLRWLSTQTVFPVVDSWHEASDRDCTSTLNRGERQVCIDHLFRSSTAAMETRWISNSLGLEARFDDEPPASDHLAVCAQLRIHAS